jgi:hypothetical protein
LLLCFFLAAELLGRLLCGGLLLLRHGGGSVVGKFA